MGRLMQIPKPHRRILTKRSRIEGPYRHKVLLGEGTFQGALCHRSPKDYQQHESIGFLFSGLSLLLIPQKTHPKPRALTRGPGGAVLTHP